MNFHHNLPELLAVDLEASSSIFQSRQLTAGTPAPGLSDDGSKRHYSFQQNSGYLGSVFRSQPLDAVTDSNPVQTIHKKYSDIFAPLDYSYAKRSSISSSDCSADMEPPSLSTREESVLTVDTWLEPERNAPPTLAQKSAATEYDPQISWIDLEDMSPVTERRRSSMTDFTQYTQQSRGKSLRTMSLDSRVMENEDAPIQPVNRKLSVCPAKIPRRRSSLIHQEVYLARQQLAKYFNEEHLPRTMDSTQHKPDGDDDSRLTYVGDAGISYHQSEEGFTLRDTPSADSYTHQTHPGNQEKMIRRRQKKDREDEGPGIASAEVGFGEWLESDMAHIGDGDQQSPRPLPPNIMETCRFFVANFPEPMLTCSSLVVEKIRELSRGIRYDTEGRRSPLAVSGQPAHSHQTRLSKWKWLGNPTGSREQLRDQPESLPDTPPVHHKFEWSVMRKIFPLGRDDLCEALYAYVLAYNYATLLCRRLPLSPPTSSRPASPWAPSRPGTSGSGLSSELDMYAPTPRPSLCETGGIPRKAASILGLGGEGVATPPSFVSSTRRSSRSSSSRTSAYTSFRNNAPFFGGTGQWQQRHNDESKSSLPRPTTAAGRPSNLTRPTTSAGYRPEQAKQLIELRHGLAMCCARLTITLHRANTKNMKHKEDRDCKVDPSFMQSLCENVRITEEAMGRTQ
jgi:hypothetical protein